ncbi:hypothetical protein, partial [Escherichia coli]|uniref:hypothetical protein n=1 Tax=Escherichia coli TaxID=562 RepID=UPI00197F0C9B
IIIAAISGCAIIFIWGALSHLLLFIVSGFTPLPNEENIIKTLESSIPKKGLYFFPGKDFRQSVTKEQECAFEKKVRAGPVVILVYRPVGGDPLAKKKLLIQLASNFITTLILSFIGSLITLHYWKKVFIISNLGGLVCASVSTIYWNCYE